MAYRKVRRSVAGGKRKRWYLNASANVPFLGKTSISMGNKTKRAIVAVVRNRLEDPLHKVWTLAPINNLLQSTIYSINLTGNIPKGDTDGSRSGDNIHLEALKYRLTFDKPATVPNPNIERYFRIMLVKCDQASGAGVDTWTASVGSTNLFFPSTLNVFYGLTNAKCCTILYQKDIKMTPQLTGTTQCVLQEGIINLKQTFTYKTDTNFGKNHNLYLVVMGHEPGATTGVTKIGECYFSGDLIFKDSK